MHNNTLQKYPISYKINTNETYSRNTTFTLIIKNRATSLRNSPAIKINLKSNIQTITPSPPVPDAKTHYTAVYADCPKRYSSH